MNEYPLTSAKTHLRLHSWFSVRSAPKPTISRAAPSHVLACAHSPAPCPELREAMVLARCGSHAVSRRRAATPTGTRGTRRPRRPSRWCPAPTRVRSAAPQMGTPFAVPPTSPLLLDHLIPAVGVTFAYITCLRLQRAWSPVHISVGTCRHCGKASHLTPHIASRISSMYLKFLS